MIAEVEYKYNGNSDLPGRLNISFSRPKTGASAVSETSTAATIDMKIVPQVWMI